MSTFYLVRHAHTAWTPDENRPLSGRGRDDALLVAGILQRYPIGVIYSSPFLRAIETITPLAGRLGLPVNIEPGLRERQLGISPIEDFCQAVEATWKNPSFVFPEGEPNAVAQQRGLGVVQRMQEQHPAEHIVLSTHGNLMALILQGYDPLVDFDFWKSLTIPDIYLLDDNPLGKPFMDRLWQE